MLLNLSQIGQIALPVSDVDRSEEFYATVVGLRKLYRYGNLSFFDCAGVRLLLEKTHDGSTPRRGGCISRFRTPNWNAALRRSGRVLRITGAATARSTWTT